ncbi:MAG TPA: DUF1707 domain-containing protein [Verrucomicrobiae bacterium]|nr:DUF1707 domain-containing protein [Verrucomicrobiae bacterium]
MSDPVSTAPQLRVSDADREQAVAELRRHHAEGRLTLEELEARAATAYRARTTGELAPVLSDLPAPVPPPPPPPGLWHRAWRLGIPLVMVAGVGIDLAVTHNFRVVGAWPILGLIVLRSRRGRGRTWSRPASPTGGPEGSGRWR